jgi:hypothetical protein
MGLARKTVVNGGFFIAPIRWRQQKQALGSPWQYPVNPVVLCR